LSRGIGLLYYLLPLGEPPMFSRTANIVIAIAGAAAQWFGTSTPVLAEDEMAVVQACHDVVKKLATGLPRLATVRSARFLGRGSEAYARCTGGEAAVAQTGTPWVDWQNYWATGDADSKSSNPLSRLLANLTMPSVQGLNLGDRNQRGIFGALLDLERQRM